MKIQDQESILYELKKDTEERMSTPADKKKEDNDMMQPDFESVNENDEFDPVMYIEEKKVKQIEDAIQAAKTKQQIHQEMKLEVCDALIDFIDTIQSKENKYRSSTKQILKALINELFGKIDFKFE